MKLILVWACFVVSGICGSVQTGWAGEKPVVDRAFEAKLVVRATYRTRLGETLSDVAHLLYGHTTWWVKIRRDNASFSHYGPQDVLPAGTKLSYRAPKISGEYVVQKNDWLIRIAEWKYGSTEYWPELFQKNAERIQDPNVIHPGDRLILSDNGTIRNLHTGRELVHGVSRHSRSEQVVESSTVLGRLYDAAMDSRYRAFFVGFAVGLVILLLAPLALWLFRRLRMRGLDGESSPRASFGMESGQERPNRRTRHSTAALSEFKRRPTEEPRIDKSMIPRDGTDIDRRPGYHSLHENTSKKYLKYGKKA